MQLILIALSILSLHVSAEADAPNPLWTQIVGKGVEVRPEEWIALPQPTMPDGLDAAAQRQALLSITDRSHPLDGLLRESIVAPFVLKIESQRKMPDSQPLRFINVWFIAYGDIELVANESFLRDAAKLADRRQAGGLPSRGEFLTEEELLSRDLPSEPQEGLREGWFRAEFELLERVYLGVTRHTVATRTDESALVASRLDPRFVGDSELPNQWQKITRNESGGVVLGDAHPYSGAAFYLKVTQLHEPAGALFIEYHHVFDEPQEWFNGKNLLRSKLPLMVRDGVRKFRRKLANASNQAP